MMHIVQLRLRHMLVKLCQLTSFLPSSYILDDVQETDGDTLIGGGFADIICGEHQNRKVAIKRLRIFLSMSPQDVDVLKKVRIYDTIEWRIDVFPYSEFYLRGLSGEIFHTQTCSHF